MKPFSPKLPAVSKLNGITLTLLGTFALREFPEGVGVDNSLVGEYVVDRWAPSTDKDREMIAQFKETRGSWYSVNSRVWFGFEEEAQIWTEHNKEYFNLIVVRHAVADSKNAVMAVSTYLSQHNRLWFG